MMYGTCASPQTTQLLVFFKFPNPKIRQEFTLNLTAVNDTDVKEGKKKSDRKRLLCRFRIDYIYDNREYYRVLTEHRNSK